MFLKSFAENYTLCFVLKLLYLGAGIVVEQSLNGSKMFGFIGAVIGICLTIWIFIEFGLLAGIIWILIGSALGAIMSK